ncbi:Dihydroorotase homodimeric type [gamma proteobacterium HdN1]|nr:Dihydroorotase homodimeric type [gamma proteobacterium HdN1]
MQLEITTPDDWHVHFRDGDALQYTVPATAKTFGRAIVMPNLVPPITTVTQAEAYRQRILAHAQGANFGSSTHLFEPLMTLYLTEQMASSEIAAAAASPHVFACKLYPAGATTNSANGVRDPANIYPLLEAMEKLDLPLLVHGEVTEQEVDIFDREAVFIDRHLAPIAKNFPGLRIVFEHITTAAAVDFVKESSNRIGATLTPQHLMHNRNDLLVGGIRPHLYCLPILKAANDQRALQQAAISGNPRFFLGTDSAPHARLTKEAACGCAGCYSAPTAIELYAEIFEQLGALDKLEGFASFFGADFYRLPRNITRLRLQRTSNIVPERAPFVGEDGIVPLHAGKTISWQQS